MLKLNDLSSLTNHIRCFLIGGHGCGDSRKACIAPRMKAWHAAGCRCASPFLDASNASDWLSRRRYRRMLIGWGPACSASKIILTSSKLLFYLAIASSILSFLFIFLLHDCIILLPTENYRYIIVIRLCTKYIYCYISCNHQPVTHNDPISVRNIFALAAEPITA